MVSSINNTFATLSFEHLHGRPAFVSEWDHAWPDEWRAESPLAYAAVAALQGWGGVTIHTYRYSTWRPENRLGGGASTINGVTYRNHFDSFNDPAKFGLFYHAALLFRRGDVSKAAQSVAVQVAGETPDWLLRRFEQVPALELLPERHRVGMLFPGQPCNADIVVPADKLVVDPSAGEVSSDTGELWRSWTKRYGWIDTPRTQGRLRLPRRSGQDRPARPGDGSQNRFRHDRAELADRRPDRRIGGSVPRPPSAAATIPARSTTKGTRASSIPATRPS